MTQIKLLVLDILQGEYDNDIEDARVFDQILAFKVNQALGLTGETIEELKRKIPEKTVARYRRDFYTGKEQEDGKCYDYLKPTKESLEKAKRRQAGRESHIIAQRRDQNFIIPIKNIGVRNEDCRGGIKIKEKTIEERFKDYNHNRGVKLER